MGSLSGIALREADGKVHKTSGNAQDISWFVNNLRLANSDPKHIQKFLQDYDFSGDDHQDLRPVGSGLVVVDMINNTLLRYQNVTSVSCLDGVIITEDARALIEEHGVDPDSPDNVRAAYLAKNEGSDEYACVRFREFLTAKRVKRVYDLRKPEESIQLHGKGIVEIDALMRAGRLRCELDMKPFEVITYAPHTIQGARDLQAKLASLGFQATREE